MMAHVFGSPELVESHLVVFSQEPKSLNLAKDHSPPSQSADSLRDGEPELDSDADPSDHLASSTLLSSSSLIDPEPHVSNQFYTFNCASHHLMVQCILENRYASPDEIRNATPPSVLASWRGVWKDRNEDTAYLTGWKRIQDKLHAQVDSEGNEMLYFKNNPQQFVPHINQWQDIVQGFHGDADLKHLGLKETIERIKQVWTVGAKFYGIPESYIRVCVASCPVCCSDVGFNQTRSKRRRFEYTESFEVQAKEVPQRLQQLAAKHQVVLCIRQKYIRCKPFLAEVKDYCCHRAGEPNSKKPGVLKRKRYSSKRCGCGFRIRAIVPITNYSEKEKTFTYQEEGQAVFKLYAVHSGHKPGPHEGSARIIHRFVGPADLQLDTIPPFQQEEDEVLVGVVKDDTEARDIVLQQIHELRLELSILEGKVGNICHDEFNSLSQDLVSMTQRLRSVEEMHTTEGQVEAVIKDQAEKALCHSAGLGDWGDTQNRNKDEMGQIVTDDPGFGSTIGPHTQWRRQELGHSSSRKRVPSNKDSKWTNSVKDSSSPCQGKSILAVEGPKHCETDDRQDQTESVGPDVSLVGMTVDNYYQENVKWYDGMTCALDPTSDCADDLSHSVALDPTTDCADDLSHTVQAGFPHAIV